MRLDPAHLVRAYDRAADKLGVLGEAVVTLIEVALFKLHSPRPAKYPLRCRHCARPIQFASANHPTLGKAGAIPRALFRAADATYYCFYGIPHQPMPVIDRKG